MPLRGNLETLEESLKKTNLLNTNVDEINITNDLVATAVMGEKEKYLTKIGL